MKGMNQKKDETHFSGWITLIILLISMLIVLLITLLDMHSISKQQEELTTEIRTETESKNSLDVDLENKITTESQNDYVKYLPENALHPIEMGVWDFIG